MPLRLGEAQQLFDALNDPTLKASLEAFVHEEYKAAQLNVLRAIRKRPRDHDNESALTGRAETYEVILTELHRFAEEQLKKASQ